MPGISMFNRRWNIASDDLFYPSLFEILFRSSWLVFQLILYSIHNQKFECIELNLLKIYFLGFLCTLMSIILIQSIIMYISTLGTISNSEPRRSITKFIYVRIVLMVFELVWSSIGVKWLVEARTPANCFSLVFYDVLANIIFCFVAIVSLSLILIILMDPISHLPTDEISLRRTRILSHFRALCCCCNIFVGKGQHYTNSYNQIGSILELLFRNGDLTPTDLTAGLLLLSKKEIHQYEREFRLFRSSAINQPSTALQVRHSWMNVNEASYYIRYALAIYSWPYYTYMNPIKGLCKFGKSCCVCCCCSCCCLRSKRNNRTAYIDGDNKCNCYYDAFKRIGKLKDCDVVYVNFRNELFQTPFFIAIDHYKRVVIISIRGTLSIRDVITDITAISAHIDIDNELKNEKCHHGILNTAENIFIKIKRDNLLEQAFQYNRNYELVITGHSLGAGAATILSLKLKAEYPNLRCIGYSPPGHLLSEKLADYTKSFVMSVIIGDDIICRLSLRSVHDIKARIIKELEETKLPKYKILWNTSVNFLFDCLNWKKSESLDDLIEPENNEILDNTFITTTSTEDYPCASDKAQASMPTGLLENTTCLNNDFRINIDSFLQSAFEGYEELKLPGQILYIYRIKEYRRKKVCCKSDFTDSYDLRWADRSEFKNIVTTKHMLIDHFPNRVEDALKFFYQYSEVYV